MLTLVKSNRWIFFNPWDWEVELSSGDTRYGDDTIYRYYYKLVIPPDDQDFDIELIDLDFFESPESVEHLLIDSRRFEYLNHSWNDVRQGKVIGTIINVPNTELQPPWCPVDNTAMNGKRSYAMLFAYKLTKSWHSEIKSFDWGYKPLRNQMFFYLYYDPATRIYYHIRMQFYQGVSSDGPVVVGFYGEDLGFSADYVYYLDIMRWYAGSGNYCYYQSHAHFMDYSGNPVSTRITVTAVDTEATLAARFREYILADRVWRMHQPGFGIPINQYWSISDSWIRDGSSTTFSLKKLNFDIFFPEKERNPNWSALAGEAYQSLGMADINGVANIKELISFGDEVRSFAKTLEHVPHAAVKNLAAAWLAVHYGFKLTMLDINETLEVFRQHALKRSSLSKCQAVENWSVDSRRYSARYQVFFDEFANVESYLVRLQNLTDATLTSENLWDMVPWSFVVDWFINVGDLLQSLDNYANLMQKHNVICCGRSIKGTSNLVPSQINLPSEYHSGQLVCSYYTRAYQSNLIRPSLVPSVTVNPFNHLVEAAALYISIK